MSSIHQKPKTTTSAQRKRNEITLDDIRQKIFDCYQSIKSIATKRNNPAINMSDIRVRLFRTLPTTVVGTCMLLVTNKQKHVFILRVQ